MSTILFDTLKMADRLQAGGFTLEQAKTVSTVLSDGIGEWLAFQPFVTKIDIGELHAGMETVKHDVSDMKAVIATRADLAETKAEILKWVFGTIGLQTVAIIGTLVGLLHNAPRM